MTEKQGWRSQITLKVTPAVVEIEPKTTALLVVDMQNLSCNPKAGVISSVANTFPEEAKYIQDRVAQVVIPNIKKLLKFSRDNKLRVFHFQFGSRTSDGSDLYTIRKIGDAETQQRTGTHFVYGPGDFEYEIVDELKPQPGELVENKRTRSAFLGTALDHTLRMAGIESVLITGGWTESCVLATALNAIDLGYKGILIEDATATLNPRGQDSVMMIFESYFSKVKTTDEVIAELSGKLK